MKKLIRKTTWILAVAATALLTASLATAHGGGHGTARVERTPGPPTTVAFYEVQGCPICKKINGWLDGLEKEQPGAAIVQRKPSADAQSMKEMAALGIEHHGVAILGVDGEAVWVGQAHDLTQAVLVGKFRDHVVDDRTIRAREIACGSCIYGMPGVQGCQAAIQVDGAPLLMGGLGVDAHGSGLCGGAKQARVAGHVDGETFVATFVAVD